MKRVLVEIPHSLIRPVCHSVVRPVASLSMFEGPWSQECSGSIIGLLKVEDQLMVPNWQHRFLSLVVVDEN